MQGADRGLALFDGLFGRGIVVAENLVEHASGRLFADEQAGITSAVPSRRAEFVAGRTLARVAMRRLGLPPQALPVGPDRAPLWPANIVGSITHAAGYCAVAVGARCASSSAPGLRSIGLDLEPDNLDPAVTPFAVSHSVMMNIYDSLIWLGIDQSFYPGLASSWEAAADGLSYTFVLRDDVSFHDGTPRFDAGAARTRAPV